MRLKYDEANDVYVAPKHSTSFYSATSASSPKLAASSSSSSLLDQQTKLVEKIRMKNCVVMRRYYKLVFLILFALSTLFIYLTFIRSSSSSSSPTLSKLPSSRDKDEFVIEDRKIISDEFIKCDIYMESQCSDTTTFFETQLMPAWPKIRKFVDLKIVPYGKAKDEPAGTDDYTFRCQHGTTECLVNQMMCCGMKRLNFVTENYLPFLKCLQGEQPTALRRCCERSNLLLSDIENCANGKEGRQLHHDMGNLTRQLNPKLSFVPWIVINGKGERGTHEDFVKVLCRNYKKTPMPTVCAGYV